MERIKSEEHFHKTPHNFNCAQAVLKGFQHHFQIEDEEIETFRAHGGGRAAEGLCGALHAANHLMKKLGHEPLNQHFIEKAIHEKCKDIKLNKTCTCEECVKIADELVQSKIVAKSN